MSWLELNRSRCRTSSEFNVFARLGYFRVLREYDVVFTPRNTNEEELRLHGCRRVEYPQFGYDESLFFPQRSVDPEEDSDLFFAAAETGTACVISLCQTKQRRASHGLRTVFRIDFAAQSL